MDWIVLVQDRDQWTGFVKTILNVWVSQNAGMLLSNLTTGGPLRDQIHGVSQLYSPVVHHENKNNSAKGSIVLFFFIQVNFQL
jgi:hypothetical protein